MPPIERDPDPLTSLRETLGDSTLQILERLTLPVWIADRRGSVRFINQEAIALLGDLEGRHFSNAFAATSVNDARELFAHKILGGTGGPIHRLTVRAIAGEALAEMLSLSLRDDTTVVGVLSLLRAPREGPRTRPPSPRLTGSQQQVLELLALGLTAASIAETLSVPEQEAAFVIRVVQRELGAATPLMAVVTAFRNEWL